MLDHECGRLADGRGHAGLSGQERVHRAWRARAAGRGFIRRDELDLSAIGGELAHVSVLARETCGLRFRIAGSGLRHAFGREARGMRVDEIEVCEGAAAWSESALGALARTGPQSGRTRTDDGMVHYWLRLPMSSDGASVDMVLCHDRYLPAEALADPEMAARAADAALRLDGVELRAA